MTKKEKIVQKIREKETTKASLLNDRYEAYNSGDVRRYNKLDKKIDSLIDEIAELEEELSQLNLTEGED